MSEEVVTDEDVRHIASLARVELTEDEVEQFVTQFGNILEYFETLDDVAEIDREQELTNVMRTDEVSPCLEPEEALQNAGDTEDNHFKGPNVS